MLYECTINCYLFSVTFSVCALCLSVVFTNNRGEKCRATESSMAARRVHEKRWLLGRHTTANGRCFIRFFSRNKNKTYLWQGEGHGDRSQEKKHESRWSAWQQSIQVLCGCRRKKRERGRERLRERERSASVNAPLPCDSKSKYQVHLTAAIDDSKKKPLKTNYYCCWCRRWHVDWGGT